MFFIFCKAPTPMLSQYVFCVIARLMHPGQLPFIDIKTDLLN
ncbi:hypothetical protein BH11BAC5_BH11BAC5_18760 [soil metagenome]